MSAAPVLAALLAAVSAEWVEISQQHYRKPLRVNHNYPQVDQVTQTFLQDDPVQFINFHNVNEGTRSPIRDSYSENKPTRPLNNNPMEEDALKYRHPEDNIPVKTTRYPNERDPVRLPHHFAEDDTFYANRTLTEHNWKNDYRVSGNVKRVSADNIKHQNNDMNLNRKYELNKGAVPESVTKNKLKDEDRISATIERVPNIGSVRRVQLTNTPVKSPSIVPKRNSNGGYGAPGDHSSSDEFDIKSSVFTYSHEDSSAVTEPNDIKHIYSSTEEVSVSNYNNLTVFEDTESVTPYTHKLTHKHNVDLEPKIKNTNEDATTTKPNNNNFTAAEKTEHINGGTTKINKKLIEQFENINIKEGDEKSEFVTKYDKVEEDIEEAMMNHNNRKISNQQGLMIQNPKPQKDIAENTTPTRKSGHTKEKSSEGIKANTLENVLNFMKVVADTISKNTRKGGNSKVQYLNELKDTLLTNIESRIEATWPDDDSGSPSRRRSRSATARGHVEFPSSESALMTISFLTFAVFLIKLVLQVIQTYKHKAMMVAPLMVATAGRTYAQKLRSSD